MSPFVLRLKKFQALLKKEKIDAYLVENPSDLFYFTGLTLSLGHLWICPETATLFVDGRYIEAARSGAKSPELVVASLEIALEKNFIEKAKLVACDGQTISYQTYKNVSKGLGRELVAKEGLIGELRRIKTEEEIEKMQRAAVAGYEAYRYTKRLLKPGISEREVAAKLKIHCLKEGIDKLSFEPIIAFGKNTAYPHHRPGNAVLEPSDIVLIDLGVMIEGYCSDMTRVVFIGSVDPQLKKLYEVVKKAQSKALALCRPGVLIEELDIAARKEMAKEGLEEYFTHSLGHGVGIDIHETPRIKKGGPEGEMPLQEGMVITIEPGLYLPGKGGVRYEDTIVITAQGHRNFYTQRA